MKIWNLIDEKAILNKLLKNKKEINIDTYQKIVVYIKHLKSKGLNKIEIRNKIDELLLNNLDGFVYTDWDSSISKAINKYTKPTYREFKEINKVRITKEELEFIKSKDNIETEKLLFTLLVLGKLSQKEEGKDLWVNIQTNHIFKLAQYKLSKHGNISNQREGILYELGQQGLLSFPEFVTATGIKLNYGKTSINNDEVIMNLELNEDNIGDVVLEYLFWRGDQDIIKCENCGRLVKPKNKKSKTKTKYCDKCAREINIKKTLERKKQKV